MSKREFCSNVDCPDHGKLMGHAKVHYRADGKWIDDGSYYRCSTCETLVPMKEPEALKEHSDDETVRE